MFDTEKFISEIEQQSCLYDVTSNDYSNKKLKAQCWNEICEIMVQNWRELNEAEKDRKVKDHMKKWKAIRDSYVKELRVQKKIETGTAKRKKTYVFFDQLSFLAPYVQRNESTSNIPPPEIVIHETNENSQDQPVEIQSIAYECSSRTHKAERRLRQHKRKATVRGVTTARSIASSINQNTKTLTSILSKSVGIQREENTADKFGNKAFLMSYIPVMDNLPTNLQMRARYKISEMFNEFTSLYDQPPASSSI